MERIFWQAAYPVVFMAGNNLIGDMVKCFIFHNLKRKKGILKTLNRLGKAVQWKH